MEDSVAAVEERSEIGLQLSALSRSHQPWPVFTIQSPLGSPEFRILRRACPPLDSMADGRRRELTAAFLLLSDY